jgi:hypothetical protein
MIVLNESGTLVNLGNVPVITMRRNRAGHFLGAFQRIALVAQPYQTKDPKPAFFLTTHTSPSHELLFPFSPFPNVGGKTRCLPAPWI